MELVIVLVIIGILATLRLSTFGRARERSLLRQAIVELRMIKDAENAYRLKRGIFTTCLNANDCSNVLGLDFYGTANMGIAGAAWGYMVNAASGANCAYAVRAGAGTYAGCTYRFYINGVTLDPVYNSGTCP